jgi:hypothetical protein
MAVVAAPKSGSFQSACRLVKIHSRQDAQRSFVRQVCLELEKEPEISTARMIAKACRGDNLGPPVGVTIHPVNEMPNCMSSYRHASFTGET